MKRKGLLISTLVMSLGGLALDRFVLSGGGEGGPIPPKLTPDQLMAMGAAGVTGSPTPGKPESQAGPPVRDLIASLGAGGAGGAMAGFATGAGATPDAFASLNWATNATGPSAGPATGDGLRLSAVVTGSRPAAVVNGLVLRPGVARDGLTLIRVDGDRVLVERAGERIELVLDR